MFDTLQTRLVITGRLVTESPLRIGTNRGSEPVGIELAALRNTSGEPFIPGSSLKGVLRSYLESVLRAWHDSPFCACNPVVEDEWCVVAGQRKPQDPQWRYPETYRPSKPIGIEDLRQGLGDTLETEQMFSNRLAENLCLICQVFGSPWLASHVRVADLPVEAGAGIGQFEVRNGVAIDRDKGTAASGMLYDYEVIPVGVPFTLNIVGENLLPWQAGLVWLGIRALAQGDLALGGFTSRGLGWVKLVASEGRYYDAANLMTILAGGSTGKLVTDTQAQSWVQALRNRVKQLEEVAHA